MFDALAIYNALRAHGSEITTKTMGVAASAASLVFMAGDKRIMPENTFLMVHNPLTLAYGNAEELRDMADVLDKIGASLVNTYVARSGKSEDEVKAMLAEDTWLNAADAVAAGFADEIEPEMRVAATFDTDRLPENIKAVFDDAAKAAADEAAAQAEAEAAAAKLAAEAEAAAAAQAEAEAAAAKVGETLAEQITKVSSEYGLADFAATVALFDDVVDVASARARFAVGREVKALCELAGVEALAPQLIRAGASIAEARKQIMDAKVAADEKSATSNVRKMDQTATAGAQVWSKIFPTAAQTKVKE